MKILIVSGFLGAGKTTFIKRLSQNIGKKFVILENEYGAAGIDGLRLGKSQQELRENIWEMTEKCICCSGKKDFASSVLTIANAVDPEYLIVEPTGIGKLSRIVENLRRIEYDRIQILPPVTIVDIYSYNRYMTEYPDLYKDQIRSADTIIVSKTEQCNVQEKDRIRKFLGNINSSAEIVTDYALTMGQEEYKNLLRSKKYNREINDIKTKEKLPDVFSLENVRMKTPEKLFWFLERVIHGRFGNIIRAKGQLMAGQQFLRFDVADSRYSITGADQKSIGKTVFIGEKIRKKEIRKNFEKSVGDKKIKYIPRNFDKYQHML